jgi:tRNA-dihydrouridine synthase
MIRAYFEMLLAEANACGQEARDTPIGDPAGKMKQFATWFTHGVPGGAKLRAAIYHAHTGAEVLAEVERFFAPRLDGSPDGETEAGAESADLAQAFPEAALICD